MAGGDEASVLGSQGSVCDPVAASLTGLLAHLARTSGGGRCSRQYGLLGLQVSRPQHLQTRSFMVSPRGGKMPARIMKACGGVLSDDALA